MYWLSLTNSFSSGSRREPRLGAFASIVVFTSVVVFTGCGHKATTSLPGKLGLGYVNIAQIAALDPGWAGVANFDSILKDLSSLPAPVLSTVANGSFNGLTPEKSTSAVPVSNAELTRERARLASETDDQLVRFEDRRTAARIERLSHDTSDWQRAGSDRATALINAALNDFSASVADLKKFDTSKRLNLRLQIRALETTIAYWSPTKPPAPQLSIARSELHKKTAELSDLDNSESLDLANLMSLRDLSLIAAKTSPAAYVKSRYKAELQTIVTRDNMDLRAYRAQLNKQTANLLIRGSQLGQMPVAVASSGSSNDSLSVGFSEVHGQPISTKSTVSKLERQRQYWISQIYRDTRIKVVSIAKQEHWKVTFAQEAGAPDYTAHVAEVLRRQTMRF